MKKIILTATFINCFGSFLYSQTNQLGFLGALQTTTDVIGSINRNQVIDAKREKENSIAGSPYLSENFTASSTPGFPDKFIARYNIYKDIIEVKVQDKIYNIPKNEQFQEITIDNTRLKLLQNKYYIELYKQDKVSLLKKENIKYIKAKSANNSFDFDTPAKYALQKPIYYIDRGNGEPIEITKKSFKDNPAINKFIEDSRIDLKNENDLKKLVQHIVQ